jgi:IS1 family transposase
LRFAAFEVGDGRANIFKKLWNKVKINVIGLVCTDGNWSYSEVLALEEVKRLVRKAETCLVESYNSVLRRRLARLRRKTQCYSKSAEMLRLSVALIVHKDLLPL